MDAMQGTKDSTRRVDLLYLLDSLVQTSQKQNAERSGPSDPMVARLYRDTVSAALRRVVNCICQDLAGCEKALKVRVLAACMRSCCSLLLACRTSSAAASNAQNPSFTVF